MRTIIYNQRKERDLLLARPYLTRHTKYDMDELLTSKQIKLITGPRRTGKSTEALLMLKGKNFAYLNFDDGKLLNAWDELMFRLIADGWTVLPYNWTEDGAYLQLKEKIKQNIMWKSLLLEEDLL